MGAILNANQQAWLDDLRTTDAGQATDCLRRFDEGGYSYCCLGRGVAIMPETALKGRESEDILCELQSAPFEFLEWLDVADETLVDSDDRSGEFDVMLDGPDLLTRDGNHMDSLTATTMNDSCALTFPQIADMFAHFGFRKTMG